MELEDFEYSVRITIRARSLIVANQIMGKISMAVDKKFAALNRNEGAVAFLIDKSRGVDPDSLFG